MTGFALRAQGLSKSWRSADRTFELYVGDFALEAGQVVAVTGPSGSGKSTFLELLAGVTFPDRVTVFELAAGGRSIDMKLLLDGRAHAELAAVRAAHFGFVVQTGGLIPYLTVAENIGLAQDLAGRPDPDYAASICETLGIGALMPALPGALSVGQRQRAAIARALAPRPALILADEPTAALDPPNKRRVVDYFLRLAGEAGTAVLVASHEVELLAGLGIPELEIRTSALPGAEGERVLAELAAEAVPA